MEDRHLRNIRIVSSELLPTPAVIREQFSITEHAAATVQKGRSQIERILDHQDPRIFVVVGPCSIHDPVSALEYAQRLADLQPLVEHSFVLVMRVYFEKPRTTVGWKGFINDPFMDDSFCIDKGLQLARKLLLEINDLGVPVGTEALDPITPQYVDDLIAWTAIGARTVESQTHREMASGLSSPVGFKNGTDGNTDVMINALKAVSSPHHFLGIDRDGRCGVFHTTGNTFSHAVLRGGRKPNYDSVSVGLCEKKLQQAGLSANIMIDCSHGNSNKQPELQPVVFENCIDQVLSGNQSITGLMLESHLCGGNQPLVDPSSLKYGVSITDACIDWESTAELLKTQADKVARALQERAG